MQLLIYSLVSTAILFLSYRLNIYKALALSIAISLLILISQVKNFPYETVIFLVYINTIPIIAERFKKDFDAQKDLIRSVFEETKTSYEALMHKEKQQIEANLEREKKLHQVLSLYEISKDMSTCLLFEDIFNIFSMTLKKSFRFRRSRIVLLKEPETIETVYQIEIGHRTAKVLPDEFDRSLVDIAFDSKKSISISQDAHPRFSRKLTVVRDFGSLISIPIFVEGRIRAVLYIENLSGPHFENFMILASQFAIHFQKSVFYKKVQEISITDSLTEVSTRRYFLERFTEELRRSMRHKSNLSLLMLDLDHFKEKNDKFGHLVGDVILKEVALILKSNLREIDIIGRYGGEEFAIVLTGIGKDGAFSVAERIRENVESVIFHAYDEVVSTTVSIGISTFPDDGVDITGLIESADKALYKAKETGRNRVC